LKPSPAFDRPCHACGCRHPLLQPEPGISGASYYEGSFSNIARSPSGDYVAVSSRGNFFMTWTAGQEYWLPHNRPAARRLQNMGWTPANQIWLSTRGGEVLINRQPGIEAEDYGTAQLNSRGFGILDVGCVVARRWLEGAQPHTAATKNHRVFSPAAMSHGLLSLP
jgi:photosystem II stability/assembly factor-like uncharacterized protein